MQCPPPGLGKGKGFAAHKKVSQREGSLLQSASSLSNQRRKLVEKESNRSNFAAAHYYKI